MTDTFARVHHTIATRDDLEALAAIFGKPTTAEKQRDAELAAALREHKDRMSETWHTGTLSEQIDTRSRLVAQYMEKCVEIEAAYRGEQKRRAA